MVINQVLKHVCPLAPNTDGMHGGNVPYLLNIGHHIPIIGSLFTLLSHGTAHLTRHLLNINEQRAAKHGSIFLCSVAYTTS